MGTALSDGYMYATIFDVIIDPEYQKQGIGREIMNLIMQETPVKSFYLTSTFGNEEFYKKLGFRKHKTAFAKYTHDSDYLE